MLLKKVLMAFSFPSHYLYEGSIPEARFKRNDCITVQAPQGALYLHTIRPLAAGL